MSMRPFEWGSLGGSPFDDMFERFFAGRDPFAPSRRVQQVDISRLLNDQARDMLARAAQRAAASGSPDLDAVHLLWAATQLPATRQQLQQAGVDVDALARRLEQAGGRGAPREEVTALSPAAKRVLLDALTQSQHAGASYIGPEHLLLALAENAETQAGELLAESQAASRGLQRARGAAAPAAGAAATCTPALDQVGRDLTPDARKGRPYPVGGLEHTIDETM